MPKSPRASRSTRAGRARTTGIVRTRAPEGPVLVRDVMSRSIISVGPTTTLRDAAMLMRTHRISGIPVVSPKGALLGIVSESDLLHVLGRRKGRARPTGPRVDEWRERLDSTRVTTAMTPKPVTVAPDSGIEEAGRSMDRWDVHRLLVMDGRKLVGVVSRLDIVAALLPGRTLPESVHERSSRLSDSVG